MGPIKAVIFDFGGVLMRTLDQEPRIRWEQKLGLRRGEAEQIVFGEGMGFAYQLGQVGEAEHWRQTGIRLGLDDESIAQFRRDFFSCDRLDTDLVAYIQRLHARYHTGLLSNADLGARRRFARLEGFLSAFDSVTISAEEGVMKPDEQIFRIALARAGAEPGETIFVDDAPRNVEAARTLGFQVVHFTDPEAARRKMVALTGVD